MCRHKDEIKILNRW